LGEKLLNKSMYRRKLPISKYQGRKKRGVWEKSVL